MYITPAFGDFHTHVFDSEFAVPVDSSYRSKGIFFSQDLVNDPVGRERNSEFLERPKTVDVSFANGAVTSNYGHPLESYERMALGIGWPRNQAQRDSISITCVNTLLIPPSGRRCLRNRLMVRKWGHWPPVSYTKGIRSLVALAIPRQE